MLSVMKPPEDVVSSASPTEFWKVWYFSRRSLSVDYAALSKYALAAGQEFKKISQKAVRFYWFFLCRMIVVTVLLSGKIIAWCRFGFEASAGVLNILILATAVIFLDRFFPICWLSLEKQAFAKIYALAPPSISASPYFNPALSFWGVAGSTLLTESCYFFNGRRYFKSVKYLPALKLLPKILAASLIMGGMMYFFKEANFCRFSWRLDGLSFCADCF